MNILFSFALLLCLFSSSSFAEFESAFSKPEEKELTVQYIPAIGFSPLYSTIQSSIRGEETGVWRLTAGPVLSGKILLEKETFITLFDFSLSFMGFAGSGTEYTNKELMGSQKMFTGGVGFGGYNFSSGVVFFGEIEYSLIRTEFSSSTGLNGSGVGLKFGSIIPLSESVIGLIEVKAGACTAIANGASIDQKLAGLVLSIGFPLGDKPKRVQSALVRDQRLTNPLIY